MAGLAWMAWVAGLATLLFTVQDTHNMSISWLANRNALIAFCFGVLSVEYHIRWRQQSSRKDLIFSIILLILGLVSAEAGLCAGGYIVAWSMVHEQRKEWVYSLSVSYTHLTLPTKA